MKKVFILAASAAVSFIMFGCASGSMPNTAKAGDVSLGYPEGWTEQAAGEGIEVLGVAADAAVVVSNGSDASFIIADMPDEGMSMADAEKALAAATPEKTTASGKDALRMSTSTDGAESVFVIIGDESVDGVMVATIIDYEKNNEQYEEVIASFKA